MAILNEELLNDTASTTIPKLQAKIAQLEKTIESFKEYDKKRTEYYKDAIIRLGQLEAYVEEISSEDKKVQLLQKYKEQIIQYNKKCFLDKICRMSDIEIVSTYDSITAQQREAQLKSTIETLRANHQDLINKYLALINKTSSAQAEDISNDIE